MANTTNLDLVKPLGTDHALISVINSNMEKIDAYAGKTDDAIGGLADGLAIVTNGDTHAAITSGQFVYVRNHNTLSEGLYVATANIAEDGTLSGSNLTADSSGGLNSLNGKLNQSVTVTASPGYTVGRNKSKKIGDIILLDVYFSKNSGNIPTGWHELGQIVGFTQENAVIGIGACNGYNGAMRIEITTTGKINAQNIDTSATASGAYINIIIGT